ncbi:MAG TPA: aminofutalosine synthase MqnE [Polyangia bacterium]
MSLGALSQKLDAGLPFDFDDGLALFRERDLLGLAALANRVREGRFGDRTTFNRNLHINPTNLCVGACKLCSFSRSRADEPGAYTMSVEEACDKLSARLQAGDPVTEVHVVGGLNRDLPFDYYLELLAGLKRLQPSIHLKAFSAVEIFQFHRLYQLEVPEVLRRLVAAGLDSLPGGGAEIFAPRVRQRICPNKCNAEEWLDVHRTAHKMGLRSNCTMLYGTFETVEERVEHLLRLRALQDETGGFQAFIPLAFHPDNNALSHLPAPSAAEDLRVCAVARLLLHNIPHIKAYWVSLGIKTAQTALWFGADDFDGTVQEEKIYHLAGSDTPQTLTPADIARLIRSAGRTPVERDTLYHVVAEGDALDARAVKGPE